MQSKYGKIAIMNMENTISTQKMNKWDAGYLILYSVVLARCVYETTMFSQQILTGTFRFVLAVMVLYVAAKVVFSHQYDRKEQIIAILFVGLFGIVAFTTGYYELLEPALLIAGAKNVRFDNILKAYVVIVAVMMIIAAIASQTGIIADVLGYSPRNVSVARHSYGIIYPTDFAAHVFYLILAICCLSIWNKNNRYVKCIRWIIVVLAAVFIYVRSGAFTSTVCLMGFLLLAGILYLLNKKGRAQGICEKFKYLPVIWSGLFLALSYFYNENSSVMLKLDSVLSQRLNVSHKVWDNYDLKLFGQWIEEQGWGGTADPTTIDASKYFFIDDMYLRMLFEYGIVIFALMIAVLIIIGHKAIKAEQYVLFAAIVMIGVHSFMEHHLMEIAYDPFVLMLLAKTDSDAEYMYSCKNPGD